MSTGDCRDLASIRGSALRALVALALLAVLGCRSHPPEMDPQREGNRASERSSAEPDWVRRPLSWEKLGALEAWLESESGSFDHGLVTEARLQLSEGRLEFSRRDLESARAPAEAVRVRIESARDGFTEVLADPRASAGQRTRARVGVGAARALLDVPDSGKLVILPRSQWRAERARTSEMSALRGQWSRITVHHSAETAHEGSGGALSETVSTLRRIQKVHMDRTDPKHGWADIGYHFLIDGSGRILEGRDLNWQGAHAGGANNRQNIGICLLGDFSHSSPSPAALKSLELLLADLRRRFRIPGTRIYSHKEFSATVCPGPSLDSWLDRYQRRDRTQP